MIKTPDTIFLPAKTWALIAAGLIVLGAGGFLLRPHAPAAPVKPGAVPAVGTFRVSQAQFSALGIAPVQSMAFRSEQMTDGLIANNDDTTTPVFSPYSGHVTKLYAKLGDVVRSGAPLMAVDAAEFAQGQSDLVTAVAGVSSARAQSNLAQATEKRQHELFLAQVGAEKDWLQSQADLNTAHNAVVSAEVGLNAVRNRLRILGKSEREISVIETMPSTARISSEALVRAPIAGTVILRQVGVGQTIQSAAGGAASPLYSIANLATVWLVANVREADSAQVHLGQTLEVQVAAWPLRTFTAKIAWIAPALDPNTHRLPVRAEIDNSDGALKPLMFASFRIVTGAAAQALGVPKSALVYEGSSAHVFVAGAEGVLAVRQVQVGRDSGDMVEVTQGLRAGEKIVTSGALFIDRATEGK